MVSWWDETRDAGNFMNLPALDPETGLGGNGTGPDNCVTDGPFANSTLDIGPGQTLTDHFLSRKVNEINSTLGNETYVQECHDRSTYLDFWESTGFTTHGAGHSRVGGVMEDIDASPGGPSAQGGTGETTLDYIMTTYGIRPNGTVKEVMGI
ncbi:hypothetical protein J7337_013047 [Fusarium musae]|uniref:Tyrosinase copper-binding domain-containing protein n=1 Tax=Fusarium musae TaxID=1042133 RepID=A0A9P8IJZ9_9HYPO|nr:hypothetical protein J7337_013047 [Fusarium musae]KAG9496459.1 hypothetical protein J7337_013047 [Fusarium musae]